MAVVLVIFDHLLAWPTGGFIGVDVFFVISGFLITGHLVREHERTGTISLRAFYRRRVKRLAPVAVVVIVVVLVVARFLFSTARFSTVSADALWALLFGENWRQIAVGTDYVHAGTAVSPFQHYWSLSVEEQFYFIWPLLLVVALAIGHVRSKRVRAGIVLGVIAIVSIVWGAFETAQQPTWAYFSTFSRAWELGAGAVLACLSPWAAKLTPAARIVLAWTGLVAIIASALLLNADSVFPVPGALPAVLGTVAVIGAGTGAPSKYLWPLTNRVSNYVGTISYSLYLWHFPVVVFWTALFPAMSRKYLVPALALILVLSVLSYHWIENPMRLLNWAHPLQRERKPRRVRSYFALAALLVVAIAIPPATFTQRRPLSVVSVSVKEIVARAPTGGADGAREAAVTAAASATTWPKLQPALDTLTASDKAPEWVKDGCLGGDHSLLADPIANAQHCVYGNPDGTKTLDIFGDSIAISYAPAIRAALPSNWKIEIYTLAECPAVVVSARRADGSFDPECAKFRDAFFAHVRATHPAVVAVSSTTTAIQDLASGAVGDQAEAEWRTGTQKLLAAIAPHAGRVLVLDPPPHGAPLDQCGLALSTPSDCLAGVTGYYASQVRAQNAALTAYRGANIDYPTNLTWFCTSQGICPAFTNGIITLDDGTHLTPEGSRDLAPLVREALAPAL